MNQKSPYPNIVRDLWWTRETWSWIECGSDLRKKTFESQQGRRRLCLKAGADTGMDKLGQRQMVRSGIAD